MTGVIQDIHKELVELSKAGNAKAQYQLYQLYAKAMFSICVRMMRSNEEAEDVLQEAFTEAFLKMGSFRYEATFGAWLKRIVVNRCINALKKRRVELEFADDISKYDDADDDKDDIDNTKLSVKAIHEAIKKLPDGYRVIFSLYMLEGYDHNEIAEILGITVSTSKSQFLRSKQKIKDLLNTSAV